MPSLNSTPQKESLQDPINGRLALIFIGAIVLVGILVAAIWHVANSKEHSHSINTQPAAAVTHHHPANTSTTPPATEPANAPAKASNAPQSELNQYPTAESEATGSTPWNPRRVRPSPSQPTPPKPSGKPTMPP